MLNNTSGITANTLTTILTPTTSKALKISLLTYNLSDDITSYFEIYLGANVIFNQYNLKSGVLYGFNLGSNFIQGAPNEALKIKSTTSLTINLNIAYEEI
jgi:hypothetical protein